LEEEQIMADQITGRWAAISAPTLETPERRARYERTKRQVLLTRQILQQINAERERRGMTKAALAKELGMTPSVVRRLFASESSNPGLGTVVAMLDVLELDVSVGPMRGRRPHNAPARSARPQARSRAAATSRTTTRQLIAAS
jgi:transcriptional regulator with XRE-family HTH domain